MTHSLWKWYIWTVSFEIQELYDLKNRRIVEIFRRYKLFHCNVCKCTHWNNFSKKCDLRIDYLGKTPRKAAAIPGNIRIIARFDGLEFMYIGFSSESVLSLKDFVIYFRDIHGGWITQWWNMVPNFLNIRNFPKPMTKTAKEFQVIENCFRTCMILHEKFPPYLKIIIILILTWWRSWNLPLNSYMPNSILKHYEYAEK